MSIPGDILIAKITTKDYLHTPLYNYSFSSYYFYFLLVLD